VKNEIELGGTTCDLRQGDARNLDWLPDESVHLVVTSPPYWTLKKYNDHPDQLGDFQNYEIFMASWIKCGLVATGVS
jgi:site-specific DNA-methyltransferase (adenine-specific)